MKAGDAFAPIQLCEEAEEQIPALPPKSVAGIDQAFRLILEKGWRDACHSRDICKPKGYKGTSGYIRAGNGSYRTRLFFFQVTTKAGARELHITQALMRRDVGDQDYVKHTEAADVAKAQWLATGDC